MYWHDNSEMKVKSNGKRPTRLAELRGAAAFPGETHNSYHFGPDAGAPLVAAAGAQGAHRRVRLAALALLQRAQVPADAGALGHVLPRGARLSALHFGGKDTVGRWVVLRVETRVQREKTEKGILEDTSELS